MPRSTPGTRLMLLTGMMGLFVLVAVAWGLKRSLLPIDAQRVAIQSGQSPFDGQRAYRDLENIIAIGPRTAGTAKSVETQGYIIAELKKTRVEIKRFPFEASTPLGKRSMTNIAGIVKGDEPGIMFLGTHYDTKYLPDIDFVGANDGGSTTAWMIEMARCLGTKRSGATVWLCFFDGEEAFEEWSDTDGLYGSRRFVEDLQNDGLLDQAIAMINVDMIGDCYLGIFQDSAAPDWLTGTIWGTARRLGYGGHFAEFSHDIEDDHVPFREAGVAAIDVIDFRYGGSMVDHRKNWHTSRDTLDRVCAQSLQAVGDVIYHAILEIDKR